MPAVRIAQGKHQGVRDPTEQSSGVAKCRTAVVLAAAPRRPGSAGLPPPRAPDAALAAAQRRLKN